MSKKKQKIQLAYEIIFIFTSLIVNQITIQ